MAVISDKRIALAALLATACVALGIAGALQWLHLRLYSLYDQEMFELLDRELAARQQIDRIQGRDFLLAGLRWRLDYPGKGDYLFFQDAAGRRVLGDLARLPGGQAAVAAPGGRLRVDLPSGRDAHVVSARLDDGALLVVSHEDQRGVELGRSTGIAALMAIFAAALVGLLAVVGFNRYLLSRIDGIATAARDIMRGQMAARAPEGQRLDALGGLARTFNEMLDQNEALVTGLRTVTESLAHDFRAPLLRVSRSIGAARLVGDPIAREAALARAETEAMHALQSFNALVNLARAESGLSRESMEPVDLAALATDLCDLFEPVIEARGQRLERDIVSCVAIAHRQILSQALGNLLENAIKYSPAGTVLRVAVRPGRAGGGPVLVVEDGGPGIPAEARERALRPFVRLDAQAGSPGCGMGLAIAAAVARLHRGSLLLEDAGPGLRVTLRMGPLEPQAALSPATEEPRAPQLAHRPPGAATV
jgi:signal transduction histidine kinase